MAVYKACQRPWSKKWQTFVAFSSKMSKDHENLVKHGTECIESFECITPCRSSGQHIQLHYYKLGHSLSVLMFLLILTLCKVLVFAPMWSALIFGNVPQQDDLDKLNLDNEEQSRSKTDNENDNWNNSMHSAYSDGGGGGYGSSGGGYQSSETSKKKKRKKSHSYHDMTDNDDFKVTKSGKNNDIASSPASAYTSHGAYD